MTALIIAALLVLVISAVFGSALARLIGAEAPGALAPPLGFAALLIAAGLFVTLPGGSGTCSVLLGVLLVAALAYLTRARARLGVTFGTAVMSAAVLVLSMIPFAASGRIGLLGMGTNDDLSEHLLAVWTLQGHAPAGSSKLVDSGYPLGPHAIVASISTATGMSPEHAFTGLIIAVPILLSLAAVALLPGGRPALRLVAGALVGLCYLQAAFMVQASFKEPIEALLLAGFTAALLAAVHPGGAGRWRLCGLGVFAAATVYVNSSLGLLWPVATLALFGLLLWLTVRPRAVVAAGVVRSLRAPAALALGVFVILVALETPRIVHFSGSSYNKEGPRVLGDLLHRLSPLEGIGIWPRLDFRFGLPLGSVGGILALLAVPVLVLALARSIRRRDLAIPAALLAAGILFAAISTRSPYTAAKALTIASPLVTLALAREALLLRAQASWRRPWRAVPALVVVVLLGAGAYSDFQVLRDAPVGPAAHSEQLARLRALVGDQPTLFLGADDYVGWELRGVNLATPPRPLYAGTVVPLRRAKAQPFEGNYTSPTATTTVGRFAGLGLAYDFNSVPAAWLDRFRFVILPRSGYRSPPPTNWRRVRLERSYELWQRVGPAARTGTLTAIDNPGAILDCSTPAGRALAAKRGTAVVQPVPVVGGRHDWRGRVGYAGQSAHQYLYLRRGTWSISLQYAAAVALTVHAPGLRAVLPASLEPLGPYWYAGRTTLRRSGWTRISVTFHPLPWAGRLFGATGLTRAPAPTGLPALGRVTAARPASADRVIPLRAACGRYVDWYLAR